MPKYEIRFTKEASKDFANLSHKLKEKLSNGFTIVTLFMVPFSFGWGREWFECGHKK
jgi:hypothetical protein